jgi:hypothetical protein
MKKLTVYYSVRGCGDGSAYPDFMESEALAEWDQDHLGWGESCTGSISFVSESPIKTEDVESAENYFVERYLDEPLTLYSDGFIFIKTLLTDKNPVFKDKLINTYPEKVQTQLIKVNKLAVKLNRQFKLNNAEKEAIKEETIKRFPAGMKFTSLFGSTDVVKDPVKFRFDDNGDIYIWGQQEIRYIYDQGWADTHGIVKKK